MDALDEFFRMWSEPEAWCQRCGECPAVHVAVQTEAEPEDILITYVRVWDPVAQEHLALCRRCSQQHLYRLGEQAQHAMAPRPYAALPYRPAQRLQFPEVWWGQVLSGWYQRLRFWFLRCWPQPSRRRHRTVSRRHTGTSSQH